MGELKHPIGEKFGRLTVIRHDGKGKNGGHYYRCRCDCGNEKSVRRDHLLGSTNSCGCLISESNILNKTKHGLCKTPEYTIWAMMKQRCYNPLAHEYSKYGGNGVTIYEPWKNSVEEFVKFMGKRPSPKHSVDRWPNKNGNYEPGNVRWATDKERGRNKNNNVLVTYRGETKCMSHWIEELGLNGAVVRSRIASGWTAERAFEMPSLKGANLSGVGGLGRKTYAMVHS